MNSDPIAETFRQLTRYEKTNELPDHGTVTDAWIICEVKRRALAAKVGSLRELMARDASPQTRAELVRVESNLTAVEGDLEIILTLRENMAEHVRGERDYEGARTALAKLRRDSLLRQQDRRDLRDAAAGWREETQ